MDPTYTRGVKTRVLLVAFGLSILAGCSPTPAAESSPTPVVESSPTITAEPGPDPVGAYEVIVGWLYAAEGGPGAIVAIDVSGTGLPEPDRLLVALQADPRYGSNELMFTTRAALEEAGLINKKKLQFEGGILVEFSNPSISAGVVTVEGSAWSGGLAATAATLTARYQDGAWVLDRPIHVVVA